MSLSSVSTSKFSPSLCRGPVSHCLFGARLRETVRQRVGLVNINLVVKGNAPPVHLSGNAPGLIIQQARGRRPPRFPLSRSASPQGSTLEPCRRGTALCQG